MHTFGEPRRGMESAVNESCGRETRRQWPEQFLLVYPLALSFRATLCGALTLSGTVPMRELVEYRNVLGVRLFVPGGLKS